METLKTILECFDVDFFKDGKTYTGRLWQDGGMIAECDSEDLEKVLAELNENAKMLVNYW